VYFSNAPFLWLRAEAMRPAWRRFWSSSSAAKPLDSMPRPPRPDTLNLALFGWMKQENPAGHYKDIRAKLGPAVGLQLPGQPLVVALFEAEDARALAAANAEADCPANPLYDGFRQYRKVLRADEYSSGKREAFEEDQIVWISRV